MRAAAKEDTKAERGKARAGNKTPISQRTVAGVESYGMMCSAAELGIGTNADEIVELDNKTKIGIEYKG